MTKPHEILKKYFTVSTMAFEFNRKMLLVIDQYPEPSTMEVLHIMALRELEKDEPNMAFIDGLLIQMENLADQNKNGKR